MNGSGVTGTFDMDRNEPLEIKRLVDMSVKTEVKELGLNDERWADYRIFGQRGYVHFERKTAQDLMGTEDIEDQLRGQYQAHPDAELVLIQEGAFDPAPRGMISYKPANGRNMMTGQVLGSREGMYKSIAGWLYSVQEYFKVVHTNSIVGTATFLAEAYEWEQRESADHFTFRRHFKKIQWHPNPQVQTLMGATAKHTLWGPGICERLIRRFGTAWAVMSASPKDISQVEGVSVAGATHFLRNIGRLDV